jgi:hypothetical protein
MNNDQPPPPSTLLDMIKGVANALIRLLNFADRMKSEERCGDNLSLTCINLQRTVELFVTRTMNQAVFILDFTNMSKKYWNELADLHKSSQKFNNRLSNNTNHFYTKDPNSTFNTIKASIDTIPILNVNESIASNQKTYHSREVIATSNDLSPLSILSVYKSIVSSNKQSRDLMPNFMEDLANIEKFPGLNQKLYEKIEVNIQSVNKILLIQLESSLRHDEKGIQSIVNEMSDHCVTLDQCIVRVLETIQAQQVNSRVYLLNTILGWCELNDVEHQVTIKTGNHYLQQPSMQQSISTSPPPLLHTNQTPPLPPKKTNLATFF